MDAQVGEETPATRAGPVLHIVVVGFHHKKGCQPQEQICIRGRTSRPHSCALELQEKTVFKNIAYKAGVTLARNSHESHTSILSTQDRSVWLHSETSGQVHPHYYIHISPSTLLPLYLLTEITVPLKWRMAQVEFSYPPLISGEGHDSHVLPEEWKYLPFLALPDGAHNFQEDAVFFHLPPRSGERKTVYGVSCYRQIEAKTLKVRQADVTRETVQKSVCVLSQLPLYGLLQAKLQLITHAYFEEKDFSQISILKELYEHMNGSLGGNALEGSQLYLGLSPRDLVLQFRHKGWSRIFITVMSGNGDRSVQEEAAASGKQGLHSARSSNSKWGKCLYGTSYGALTSGDSEPDDTKYV
ncbi:unnamed protein product [Ranitomeya imitator]|uniref:UDENN domain-containing protein n=1 Tax=Ranitomeya imitator TaxID=111125 RepID=A0ABN9L8H4_9NEOB|nr:unnamed protein product [Ranitomeya imitator]